jgi:hypothetical protein
LSEEEVKDRERTLRKLKEQLRNEEMKLVLLKKLHQSQQMKENVYLAPSESPGVNNSSLGSSHHQHNNHHQLPAHHHHQQQANHNNQLHELQNLHKLHAAGLTISGVKGRSSPKLPNNSTSNLSITSGSRDKDRDLGLNQLAHLGIPGLFGNSHIPGLSGLIPPSAHSGGNRNHHQSNSHHKSSSAKVSTLLKVPLNKIIKFAVCIPSLNLF